MLFTYKFSVSFLYVSVYYLLFLCLSNICSAVSVAGLRADKSAH